MNFYSDTFNKYFFNFHILYFHSYILLYITAKKGYWSEFKYIKRMKKWCNSIICRGH